MENEIEKIAARCLRKGECLEWQGACNTDGYGRAWFGKGRTRLVHRRLFELTFGALQVDELVLHHCDNPRCCELKHLYKGDIHNNTSDRVSRNRSGGFCTMAKTADKNPRAKLNWDKVRAIRKATGTLKQIGEDFSVPWQTVADIRSGRTWKDHDQNN